MKKIIVLIMMLFMMFIITACDKEEFVVSFDSCGGSEVASITVAYDETFDAPADPVKEGHTFAGWYLNDSLYDFNFTVRENITLYAHWTVNEYNLTFDANGGYIGDTNEESMVVKVKYQESIPTISEPTRDGYVFAGWYSDANLSTIASLTNMPASDVTFYAKWNEGSCSVSLIVDDIISEEYSFEVEVGKEIGSISYVPTKLGYTFVGWYYVDSNGNEQLINENYKVISSINLYARFSVNQYTINFVTNGGSEINPITLDYNASLTEPANPTKLGYEFKGWYTDSNLTNEYTDFPEKMPASNTTLYAKWEICSYTLTIEFNNGSENAIHTVTYNSSLASYKPANPEKADTLFIGWLYEGNLIDFETLVMPAHDMTITAKFENEIIVTFEGSTTQVGVAGQALTLPNEPTKEGYTFEGWYLDELCTEAFDIDVFPTDDLHVYAKWEINKYDVTFIIDGKEIVVPVEYNTKLSLVNGLPNANKVGYTLSWLENNIVVSLSDIIVTNELTITASYSINSYNIQYIIDGKVCYQLDNITYNTAISFDGYVSKLNNDLTLLSNLDLYVLNVIGAGGSNDSILALQTFIGTNQLALSSINDIISSSLALFTTGGLGIDGLHSILEGQISYYTGLINAYNSNKLTTGYAPFKNGYIFAGWALGEGSIYVDSTGKEYNAGDIIPNYAPASTTSDTVKLIATFKKLATIDSVDVINEDGKTTISWEAVDTSFVNTAINKYAVSYEIYYFNGEELVLLDTVSTNSYTFKEYGKYSLVIYAKVTISNLNNVVIKTLVSDASSKYIEVEVEIEGLEDTFNESGSGDYYRNGTDNEGNSVFVFYTQNEYAFTTDSNGDGKYDFTFTITDENGNPTESSVASTQGHIIKIGNQEGGFHFTNGVNKDDSGKLKVYVAYVIPYVTQFTLGKNLANYNDNKSSQSAFKEPSNSIYTIGRYNSDDLLATNDPNGLNANIYKNVLTYKNNGFSFDLAINTFGGTNIDYLTYGDYIKYSFYGLNSDNTINLNDPISNEEMGVYDKETDSWSFTAKEGLYGVVISITDTYLAPKQVKDELFPSISFVFKLDNSINVYTHEEFKTVYSNMSLGSSNVNDGYIVRGISLHSSIVATLSENQVYSEDNDKNPGNAHYEDRYGYGKKDGSPINMHPQKIYQYLDNEDFETGNVYMRASKEEIKEIYNINGNFFTINGQNLPYASINSISNLSSINGYKIANVQISMLLYLVGGDNNDEGLGRLVVNDLQLISNTSKPTFDSSNATSSLEMMNRNSGGYCGITVDNGNALTLNNCIISNANLGVRADNGTLPSGNNPGTVVYIKDSIIRSCWSNCVYGYYSQSFDFTNSLLQDAGGAAIHLADTESLVNKPIGTFVKLDDKTVIDNFVAGTEGYFKANNMELVAMQIKAQLDINLDNITNALNTNFGDSVPYFTVIRNVVDPITHQSSEKFNFQFLFVAAGKNADPLYQDTYAQANLVDVYLPYKSYAHANQTLNYIGYTQAFTSKFGGAYSVDYLGANYDATQIVGQQIPYALAGLTINENYNGQGSEGLFMFAQSVPGQGTCLIGVGVDKE